MSSQNVVGELVTKPYKYGFVTDIETEKIEKGLNDPRPNELETPAP